MNANSAGCLFTNGQYILAGLQIKNGHKIISGIGGRCEEDEDSIHNAIRETIEELFEIYDVPEVIDEILIHYIPRRFITNNTYTILVYTFEDLLDFVKIIESYHLYSPIYETFPKSMEDFLLKRTPTPSSEIKALVLLPNDVEMSLDPLFLSDLVLLNQ